jgi:hypothetical protein
MATIAKHFNITRISCKQWTTRVRQLVMAMQMICAAASFAFSNLFNFITARLSGSKRSLTCPTFPFWMLTSFGHVFTAALNRTIFHIWSFASFTSLKIFSALRADCYGYCPRFTGFDFLRTFTRARMGSVANVSIRALKQFAANCAMQFCRTSLGY